MTPALQVAFKLATSLPSKVHFWSAPAAKSKKYQKKYWRDAKRRARAKRTA